MANIHPFQPYRYASQAGAIENLVTQPYDKISPPMQQRYLGLSPHNLVRVILGEKRADDSDGNNVYTRAAAHLNDWIEKGILAQDPVPGFYAYFQDFTDPDTGEKLTRKGFIGLGDVVDYEAGIVHRHERTLAGPKKDRLELLRHARAHFGQLFMLYPDPAASVDALLDEEAQGTPLATIADEYGASHRIWRISEPARVQALRERMADKKLLIADGHHRYETALAFRNENPDLEGAKRVMMTFVNMHSPGLRILATHRLVHSIAQELVDGLAVRAGSCFEVTKLAGLPALKAAWAEPHSGAIRIGAMTKAGLWMLETPRGAEGLDVRVLHDTILDGLLGVTPEAIRQEKFLRYMRGTDNAAAKVASGEAQIAFLLEPTSVEQVASISFSGGVMPQKSTDFYPKLLSGLTIYRVE
jgi:uncharacterized protein (DUF1015 family)